MTGKRVSRHGRVFQAPVEEKLERDRLQEALDEVWAKKSMTKKEREWADEVLRARGNPDDHLRVSR